MIQKKRITHLNNAAYCNAQYILYWMQQSQRTEYNHALEHAIHLANKYEKPLVVFFGLTTSFPDANLRHYHFMLEGLKKTKEALEDRGIKFVLHQVSPDKGAANIAKNASMVVTDKGYLKIQREWRKQAAKNIKCSLVEVESDVVVPVEFASDKEEYAARTIRPKITKKLDTYLLPVKKEKYNQTFVDRDFESLDIKDVSTANIDDSVKPVETFSGGTDQAVKQLNLFLKEKIDDFPEKRNNPNLQFVSNLSPYLHFGQISSLFVALKTLETDSPGADSFLEELIIRRELSMNYVHYNPHYDSFKGLPQWAKNSLKKHADDPRPYTYSLQELENAETHDDYWNAAQKQMIHEGKMHGYMRMYWGKKIIEWTETPKKAFQTALYLNNKYELDGRDPNGYTGIAWCFGKHDRAWKERSIFGKIRYMNAKGLQRKFNAENYAQTYL